MKKIVSIISALLAVGTACSMLSSCNKNNDAEYQVQSAAFVTIGNVDGQPVLYIDGGGIIYPTKESVDDITKEKGFGDEKRAYIYFSYYEKDLEYSEKDKEYILNEGTLTGGSYLDVDRILTKAEAQEANLYSKDSLTTLSSFNDVWVYRGFLNILGRGGYVVKKGKSVRPTPTLVYNPSDIKDNQLNLTLLYNVHHDKDVSSVSEAQLLNSYDISELASIIPGTDSVTVVVAADGAAVRKAKFSRKDFTFREGVTK